MWTCLPRTQLRKCTLLSIISRHKTFKGLSVSSQNFQREEILQILKISEFSEEELKNSYRRVATEGNDTRSSLDSQELNISREIVKRGISKMYMQQNNSLALSDVELLKVDNLSKQLVTSTDLSYVDFKKATMKIGESLDTKILPLAASFLMVGGSIGIIIPCMPLIVKILAIPSSAYGFVVGAFGVSKLLGNIPSGYYVDKYGRKPAMVLGLSLCTIGIGGLGLSLIPGLGIPYLICCRLCTGLGVSAFTAGAFMYLADISTKLNRARTLAPAMAAFQSGTAFGPALGGLLIEKIGIQYTYGIVGLSFVSLAVWNHFYIPETLKLPVKSSDMIEQQESKSFVFIVKEAIASWGKLLKVDSIKNIVLLNGCYWIVIGGAQMTLLPIHMVSDVFNLGAYEIGASFAMMSVVSVAASYRIATVADKLGKVETLLAGCALVGISVFSIPFATTFPQLLVILAPLALGSTALTSIPQAYISDVAAPSDRANAMSLLRAGGDIGLIIGAATAGIISSTVSLPFTLGVKGILMLGSMVLYGIKSKKF